MTRVPIAYKSSKLTAPNHPPDGASGVGALFQIVSPLPVRFRSSNLRCYTSPVASTRGSPVSHKLSLETSTSLGQSGPAMVLRMFYFMRTAEAGLGFLKADFAASVAASVPADSFFWICAGSTEPGETFDSARHPLTRLGRCICLTTDTL